MADRLDELHDLYWPGLDRPIGFVRTGPAAHNFVACVDHVSVYAQGGDVRTIIDGICDHVSDVGGQIGMMSLSTTKGMVTNVMLACVKVGPVDFLA